MLERVLEEERYAIRRAQTVVAQHREIGRRIFETTPGVGVETADVVGDFDLTKPTFILVVTPISGG